MRGADDKQASMFSIVSPEQRIPADHPLRRIKAMADEITATLAEPERRVDVWRCEATGSLGETAGSWIFGKTTCLQSSGGHAGPYVYRVCPSRPITARGAPRGAPRGARYRSSRSPAPCRPR